MNFTWRAILNTVGIYGSAGYIIPTGVFAISNVDCTGGARTVRLKFNNILTDWMDLFGGTGTQAFILEKAAFPLQAANVKPDLRDEMTDSIPFSGGPWVLQTWTKDRAVLVRNNRYWGPKPDLDRVTLLPFDTTDAAAQALRTGEVDGIAPREPTDVPFADLFRGDEHIDTASGSGNSVVALWFQLDDPIVGDAKVREAFAYAVDRAAVAKGTSGLDDPAIQVNDCGPWIPGQGPWCPEAGPFGVYQHDAMQATSLLESAGYTCPAGGACSKGGTPLVITIDTLQGDVRLIAAAALVQEQALAVGITMQIRTDIPVDLFSNRAPLGRFQVALYPIGPVVDPSITRFFSCTQIPTRVNGYGGDNWDHFCDREAERLLVRSDQELDPTARAQDLQAAGRILAEKLPILPLSALPNVGAWRSDRIGGVDPADLSSPYGLLAGLSNWYLLSNA